MILFLLSLELSACMKSEAETLPEARREEMWEWRRVMVWLAPFATHLKWR